MKLRSSRALLLAAILVAGGPRLAWADPIVQCRADATGPRAVLRISVRDMFDGDLLRLVELGLVGRLRVQATLYRRRPVWFDARLLQVERLLSISWSRTDRRFTVEGQPVGDPNAIDLPDLVVPSGWDDQLDSGEVYAKVTAHLEVITASSLGQVARWLVGGKPPGASERGGPASGNAQLVPGALVEYLASDLARNGGGRCPLRRSGH